MYRALGVTLAKKYPHMLWDAPSTRSKKTKNTQIYVITLYRTLYTFIIHFILYTLYTTLHYILFILNINMSIYYIKLHKICRKLLYSQITKFFLQSTFVHRVSLRVKQRRNRAKKINSRLEPSSEITEVNAEEEENLSVEDAQKELKVIVISIIYSTIF